MYHLGGRNSKDYSILGSILGYPNFGKLPYTCSGLVNYQAELLDLLGGSCVSMNGVMTVIEQSHRGIEGCIRIDRDAKV